MELIVKMDGELADFQRDAHGVLYLKCVKALYGHIEAARLFYDDLDNSLTNKLGFKRNAYDPCVYNKITSDGAVTIRTHVDDLKASSRSRKQLEKFIDSLREIYGEITMHPGNEHDYLGMILKYDRDKKMVHINMKKYIDGCLEEFKEDVPGMVYKKVASPASEYLFQVCEMNGMKIPVERAKVFHSTVAKLLFVAKQG